MQISSRQAMTKDLPNFSGKPKDCPSLSRITMRIHRSREFDQTAELLKGPALEAVRRRLMMTSRVGLAVNKVSMLYGRPDVIHQQCRTLLC